MRESGFSLIEVMITVAIIAILASIAYPSYQDYVTKSRRTDGRSALLDLANRLETYYTNHNTYATATINGLRGGTSSDDGYYTLSFGAQSANAYTLLATPVGSQATADTTCQTLTLNQLGEKGIAAGPGGAPMGTFSDCW